MLCDCDGNHVARVQSQEVKSDEPRICVDVVLPDDQQRSEQADENADHQETANPLA